MPPAILDSLVLLMTATKIPWKSKRYSGHKTKLEQSSFLRYLCCKSWQGKWRLSHCWYLWLISQTFYKCNKFYKSLPRLGILVYFFSFIHYSGSFCNLRPKTNDLSVQCRHAPKDCFINTLAYLVPSISYACKMFMELRPGFHHL
jgi:hypothetical protein